MLPPTSKCGFRFSKKRLLTIPEVQAGSAITNKMGSTALPFHSVVLRESTPPPPRACFGRDDLIETVVGLADNLKHIALVGAVTFCELGPEARDLLGVIAFYPQGINGWFFPAISERRDIFGKFCVLSLTYRNNGLATTLAPIRDSLSPKDPTSSPHFCATRDCYFSRLPADTRPETSEFGETRWIVLDDANVEHLLNVFASIDSMYRLSVLFGSLGNRTERKNSLFTA